MFGFNNLINQDNISFYRIPSKSRGNLMSKKENLNDENSSQSIFLLSKFNSISIFDNIPKDFTISTKNCKCHFNLEMIKNTSSVISDFVRDHPDQKEFFLNISDDENVLSKFEQLYLGRDVIFKEDELPSCQRITKMLKILRCPNILKPDSLRTNELSKNIKDDQIIIGIQLKNFINFLNRPIYQYFKIITKKKEYVCNIFGVFSSNIIKKILEEDSNVDKYVYDFEDEYDEFQSICDFFNFNKIDLTRNNMDSLKEISENLQIECIRNQIDTFIQNYEKNSKKIDEYQTITDSIDELFDFLYNIKIHGIEKVKISIVQSNWSKKEENVQELAAFILQVVKTSFSNQKEIADLLIELKKEANETNKLNILIPFIVENLMIYFMPHQYPLDVIEEMKKQLQSNDKKQINESYINESINLCNRCIYSFIRVLYKKDLILKEKIIEKLESYDFQDKNLNAFFLPEIIEINPKNITLITKMKQTSSTFPICNNKTNVDFILFINKYLPNKIDHYNRMLDNMEPDDELTKSIRYDDVDTLQKIITINEINVENAFIPYNIFDDFDKSVNLINYAAFCGSLKCFKYLILNNGNIGETTFYFAVYGGNIEIIKIVDQKFPEKNYFDVSKNQKPKYSMLVLNNKESTWFTNNDRTLFGFKNYNNSNVNIDKDENNSSFSFLKRQRNVFFDDNLQYVVNEQGFQISCLNCCNISNIIASTIVFHRNELFDWIFEKEFVSKGRIGNELINIAILSASSGNAHTLIEIIDKGFDLSSIRDDIIYFCAKNGFYKLTKLLMNITKNNFNSNNPNLFFYKSSVLFGNLSIFKLLIEQMKIPVCDLEQIILFAIEMNYKSIIYYYFDNLSIQLNKNFVLKSLENSIKSTNDELFLLLSEKFKKLNPELLNLSLFIKLLDCSCLYSNLESTKIITDFILKENANFNFSNAFIKASSSGSMNICYYFIDKKVYINYYEFSSQVDKLGSIDAELFEMIYNNASPNIQYQLLKCFYQAIQKKNIKLIEYLLKQKVPLGSSLFHAVMTHDVKIVDLILKYNSEPSFVNKKSNNYGTALYLASSSKDLDIVKRLLSVPGIDPSLYNQELSTPLSAAIHNYDIDTVDAILNFYGDDFTKNMMDVNIAFQALHNCLRGNQVDKLTWTIIKRFFKIKSLDPNLFNESPFLIKACNQNEIEIVDFFMKFDNINVNQYAPNSYYTPLMAAIEHKNIKIAELLIKYPKTDINLLNKNNYSALIIAVKNNLTEIIDLLVSDKRFDQYRSNLCYALILSRSDIFNQLCSLNFIDVNNTIVLSKRNKFAMNKRSFIHYPTTPLVYFTRTNDVDKIDMIIEHPSFNKYKSDIIAAIVYTVKMNNINLFRQLIKLIDNDINIYDKHGRSLLVVAAIHSSGDIIDEIFNDPQFDIKKGQILTAFIESYSNPSQHRPNDQIQIPNPPLSFITPNVLNQTLIPDKSTVIEIMEKIYDFDVNHDHLIQFNQLTMSGNSFFTSFKLDYDEIIPISNFLIEHGVDPNAPDSNGIFPLEYAISIRSIGLVTSLLNSNKIDFSQNLISAQNNSDDKYYQNKYVKTTYLHLAAACGVSPILRMILDKNVIDINSIDGEGETPLMAACRANADDNINLLFSKDNLDFLHCNNEGKDAIGIIQQLPLNEVENLRKNKEDYQQKLIALINEKKE